MFVRVTLHNVMWLRPQTTEIDFVIAYLTHFLRRSFPIVRTPAFPLNLVLQVREIPRNPIPFKDVAKSGLFKLTKKCERSLGRNTDSICVMQFFHWNIFNEAAHFRFASMENVFFRIVLFSLLGFIGTPRLSAFEILKIKILWQLNLSYCGELRQPLIANLKDFALRR